MDETKNEKRIGKIEKKLNDLADRGSTEESIIKVGRFDGEKG